MENLILFYDAFDPVVSDDLSMARFASIRLNADVAFIPKKEGVAPLKDRLAMLKGALISEGTGSFYVEKDPSKGETSYSMRELLTHFRRKRQDVRLYAFIGKEEALALVKEKDLPILNVTLLVYGLQDGEELDLQGWKGNLDLVHDRKKATGEDARNLRTGAIPLRVREYIEKNGLYYMEKLPRYLSKKRLLHSLSVAHLAHSIALANQMSDASDAYVAGLLHDIGKSVDESKSRSLIRANCPEYASMPGYALHQFVGAILAKKVFGVENPNVLDAISCHCTGKAHMSPLAKVIYSADKIDPTRGYDSSKMIKACMRQYYAGFLYVLKENREYLKKNGSSADNALTEECMELYLGDED